MREGSMADPYRAAGFPTNKEAATSSALAALAPLPPALRSRYLLPAIIGQPLERLAAHARITELGGFRGPGGRQGDHALGCFGPTLAPGLALQGHVLDPLAEPDHAGVGVAAPLLAVERGGVPGHGVVGLGRPVRGLGGRRLGDLRAGWSGRGPRARRPPERPEASVEAWCSPLAGRIPRRAWAAEEDSAGLNRGPRSSRPASTGWRPSRRTCSRGGSTGLRTRVSPRFTSRQSSGKTMNNYPNLGLPSSRAGFDLRPL